MTALKTSIVAVVDDDSRVLESLEDLLESAGHSVRLYASARALLDNDDLLTIDCLISDIGLPGIDGFELQRLAKAARPELPVILITGREEITERQPSSDQGHQTFFHKPFSGQDLLAAVSKALRASRRHK
jgi:FixJ family two-component response regulator